MKKLVFLLMAFLAITSCTENEIIVKVERVPCEFHANQFLANVDDVIPMTKSGELREVTYIFEAISGSDIVKGTALESMPFKVELLKEPYKVKLITDSCTNSWFDYPDVTISATNPRVFNHIETFNVSDLVSGATKTFTLKHLAGKYVAKVGQIPANHEVTLEVIDFKNSYNWLTEGIGKADLLPGENPEIKFAASSGILYSRFVTGESNIEVKVGIRKVGTTHNLKEMTYNYKIPKASVRTITYNINNMTGNNDFTITIDDSLDILDDENQQIGKPQS